MPEVAATAPLVQTESNTARKKREKAEQAAKAAAGTSTPAVSVDAETAPATNGDNSSESPYVKELQKYVAPRLTLRCFCLYDTDKTLQTSPQRN